MLDMVRIDDDDLGPVVHNKLVKGHFVNLFYRIQYIIFWYFC